VTFVDHFFHHLKQIRTRFRPHKSKKWRKLPLKVPAPSSEKEEDVLKKKEFRSYSTPGDFPALPAAPQQQTIILRFQFPNDSEMKGYLFSVMNTPEPRNIFYYSLLVDDYSTVLDFGRPFASHPSGHSCLKTSPSGLDR